MSNASARPELLATAAAATPLAARLPYLRQRHVLLQTVRHFFDVRQFLEVETPIRLPAPALEDYIDAEPSGSWYLRTSPELHMKRLLAAGVDKLFQLGPCFRRGEYGRRHRPEFTMLEWYRAEADYLDVLADTVALVGGAAAAVSGSSCHLSVAGASIDLRPPWEQLSVSEAFRRYAGVDVDSIAASDAYDQIYVEQVEPHLGRTRPTVLIDYPLSQAALARPKPDEPQRAERWELYIAGIELANAYSELTDPQEQRRRFAATAQLRRGQGRDVYPLDTEFLAALDAGLPACAGIALGFDRLLMLLCDADCLDAVIAF